MICIVVNESIWLNAKKITFYDLEICRFAIGCLLQTSTLHTQTHIIPTDCQTTAIFICQIILYATAIRVQADTS